jgi:protein disulfide-isomerase
VIFILVIFGAVAAVVAFSRLHTPPERVAWRRDFAAAQTEAKRANKPLLAYFTADWCGPCQYMRRTVWTQQSVADAMRNVVPVEIDVDRNPALARQFVGDYVPVFIVFAPDGRTLKTHEGAFEADQLIQWIGGS